MNPISHLSAVAAAIFLLLGVYTLYLKPRARLNQIFALLCLSFTAWNVCFIFLITAPDKETAWFWYRLSAVGWGVGPALLFHFFLLLTSRRMLDRHPWLVAVVYGIAATFVVRLAYGTVYATDFVQTPYGWDEVVHRIDGWSAAYLLFYLSSAVAGLWLVYRWGARSALAREKQQARIILYSAAPTLLLVSLSNVLLRLLGVHAVPGLAPILLPIWGVGIMVAVVQYDLMVLDPRAAAQRILETMVDVLLLLDPEKKILSGNPAAAKLFGIEETQLAGMRLAELIPDVELFKGMELDHRLASGALRNEEINLTVGDTGYCMIVSAATVHDEQGLPVGTVVILNDVTERRQLQEHLSHAMKMEAIGELAGGVAHDFNNLLSVILTEAQLLRMSSAQGSEDHEGAVIIETAAQRASELTTQLLGFARRGKQRVLPVDVHAAIYETAHLLSRTLNKNIRLTLDLQADSSIVMGDPGQLQQVLLNLAINARDAMPDGGDLTFSTRSTGNGYRPEVPHLDLSSGPHLELSVRDTGCGIPVDIQRLIFDPFFTTHEKGKGSGMGLATAYGIVNGHQGAITVDSVVGRGSTFRVYLPLSAEEGLRADKQDADMAARLKTGRGRILLVDDEGMFRDVSSSALKRFGYEVVTAADGAQAVDHYRQNHERTDLVLLDMIMPTMNGLTCFRQLKRINPEVKVILVSGYALNGEVQEALDSGANGFVQKPFKIEKLVQQIRKTLAA